MIEDVSSAFGELDVPSEKGFQRGLYG